MARGSLARGSLARGSWAATLAQAARAQRGWASLRESGKTGIVVGVALLGLGFGGGYLAHSRDVDPPPPLPTPALSPAEAGALDVTLGEAPETIADEPAAAVMKAADPAPVVTRNAVPRAKRPKAIPTPEPIARERGAAEEQSSEQLTLLQRAERAVRAENPALALALVTEHAERYPRSVLIEERQAIELMAHCEAGTVDASERARRFLQEHPKSVYATRVRELCWVESTIDRAIDRAGR
jgi:hypothetical protein